MRRHFGEQTVQPVVDQQQAAMLGAQETHLAHLADEFDQPVIEACDVQQSHWFRMIADLRPAHRFPQFVHRAGAARQRHEAVGQVGERLFALVHGAHDVKFSAAAMRDLGIDQRLGNDADDFAARLKRRIRDRAHQAQPTAAIDDADATFGKRATNGLGAFDIDGIGGGRGATVNGQTLHRRSSSINFAVALALPTTPGIPAPGCVPAPTRYILGI